MTFRPSNEPGPDGLSYHTGTVPRWAISPLLCIIPKLRRWNRWRYRLTYSWPVFPLGLDSKTTTHSFISYILTQRFGHFVSGRKKGLLHYKRLLFFFECENIASCFDAFLSSVTYLLSHLLIKPFISETCARGGSVTYERRGCLLGQRLRRVLLEIPAAQWFPTK